MTSFTHSLFDAIDRTDGSRRRHGEPRFAFLNRQAGPQGDRLRAVLEEWYSHWDGSAKPELRSRFRSKRHAEHQSAFWEMYLAEAFRRSGKVPHPHPTVSASSGKPDFLVTSASGNFYAEARVIGEGRDDESMTRRAAPIYETIEQVGSPDFWLFPQIEEMGTDSPPLGALARALKGWLQGLRSPAAMGDAAPAPFQWRERGWGVDIDVLPKDPESADDPDCPAIGLERGGARFCDEDARIVKALAEKGGSYGPLDHPLVVALLLDRWSFSWEAAKRALFGPPPQPADRDPAGRPPWSPVFMTPEGTVARRVAAVVIGDQELQPWSISRITPIAMLNPGANLPYDLELPWPLAEFNVATGKLVRRGGGRPPSELFGLHEGWPLDS